MSRDDTTSPDPTPPDDWALVEARAGHELLRVTLSSIGDAVVATDPDGRITSVNQVAEALTGWAAAEAIGQPFEEVLHFDDAASGQPVTNPLKRALGQGKASNLAAGAVLVSRDGNRIPVDDRGAPILDREGRSIGAVIVFRDVTGLRIAQHELQFLNAELERRVEERTARVAEHERALEEQVREARVQTRAIEVQKRELEVQEWELEVQRRELEERTYIALHDALTSLPNRRAFDEDLDRELSHAVRHRHSVMVLSADLDGLKLVNDSEGHERGDSLLREFAQAVRSGFRREDRVYRVGGDEFVAILPHAGLGEVEAIQSQVQGALRAVREAGFARADVSIGLAVFPDEAGKRGELVRLSDARMYDHKRSKPGHR